MRLLNWLLGIAALLVWVVPVTWVLRKDLVRMWRQRGDKWFRSGL